MAEKLDVPREKKIRYDISQFLFVGSATKDSMWAFLAASSRATDLRRAQSDLLAMRAQLDQRGCAFPFNLIFS
jgi:hypothetical protein